MPAVVTRTTASSGPGAGAGESSRDVTGSSRTSARTLERYQNLSVTNSGHPSSNAVKTRWGRAPLHDQARSSAAPAGALEANRRANPATGSRHHRRGVRPSVRAPRGRPDADDVG